MKPASCVRAGRREDAADRGGAGTEDDEDDGEAEDEREARDDDAPRGAALAQLAGLDARERREVAGHERQHARQRRPRRIRPRTRCRAAAAHQSKRASSVVEPPLGLLVEPGVRAARRAPRAPAPDSSARRRRRARAHPRARPGSAATTRAGRSPCATAPRGSPGRSCATSADSICCAVQQAAIFFAMNASIRCAAGESDWSSVVWQVGHMTWPSRNGSEVRGCAHAAAAGAANDERGRDDRGEPQRSRRAFASASRNSAAKPGSVIGPARCATTCPCRFRTYVSGTCEIP